MAEHIALSVEDFEKDHPGLKASLFTEFARVALAKYHGSPAEFHLLRSAEEHEAKVNFSEPDSRSATSFERERFVEFGAIVLAGLLLAHFESKQITQVIKRGFKVDYFVGKIQGEKRWILEVGGTDEGNLTALRNEKHEQLGQSPYRFPLIPRTDL